MNAEWMKWMNEWMNAEWIGLHAIKASLIFVTFNFICRITFDSSLVLELLKLEFTLKLGYCAPQQLTVSYQPFLRRLINFEYDFT